MKAIKLIAVLMLTALVSGCVVYPVGYRDGYYGHHHHYDGPYYRR